jgi:putative SOS response-associated peptidase YedK
MSLRPISGPCSEKNRSPRTSTGNQPSPGGNFTSFRPFGSVRVKDGRPFTFAGLWENWKDPESGEWLRTCTIITGEPNELVEQIHPRMPVILPEQHHAAWLGETDDGNLKALLVPYPADEMRMWEISPRVNSPKNDDPSLWEPVYAEQTQTTADTLELLRE